MIGKSDPTYIHGKPWRKLTPREKLAVVFTFFFILVLI